MDYRGLDLGKRTSSFCIVDDKRQVLREGKAACSERALPRVFENHERMCVVLEASTNSFWIANMLEDWGHEVHVVDPNRTKAIGVSLIKNDRRDAVWLAKLASAGLLAAIRVPTRKQRIDRMPVVSRDALVRSRTRLLNAVRSLCASEGIIVPACSPSKLVELVEDRRDKLPEGMYEALQPLLDGVVGLNLSIDQGTAAAQARAKADPLLRRLQTVPGVGPIAASVFAATIADPQRFRNGREVGAYLGLVPSLYQSGGVERRGRITKRGNRQTRWVLTMAANALLCSKGDSALTRWAKQRPNNSTYRWLRRDSFPTHQATSALSTLIYPPQTVEPHWCSLDPRRSIDVAYAQPGTSSSRT